MTEKMVLKLKKKQRGENENSSGKRNILRRGTEIKTCISLVSNDQ